MKQWKRQRVPGRWGGRGAAAGLGGRALVGDLPCAPSGTPIPQTGTRAREATGTSRNGKAVPELGWNGGKDGPRPGGILIRTAVGVSVLGESSVYSGREGFSERLFKAAEHLPGTLVQRN